MSQTSSESDGSPSNFPLYRDPARGDLIIRSADGIDFHIDRRRVEEVSTVFSDMFRLPPPLSEKSSQKPCVEVSETSAVWEKLLCILHVAKDPTLALSDIPELYQVGKKYRIEGVTSKMQTLLAAGLYATEKPYSVYALAFLMGFPDIARAAAKRTLTLSIFPPPTPEFSYISATSLYQLSEYRRKCGIAAQGVVTLGKYIPTCCSSPALRGNLEGCPSPRCSATCPTRVFLIPKLPASEIMNSTIRIHEAWVDYFETLTKELEHRPDAAIACSPALLGSLISSASCCVAYATNAYNRAITISEEVMNQIEKAIAQVELEVQTNDRPDYEIL